MQRQVIKAPRQLAGQIDRGSDRAEQGDQNTGQNDPGDADHRAEQRIVGKIQILQVLVLLQRFPAKGNAGDPAVRFDDVQTAQRPGRVHQAIQQALMIVPGYAQIVVDGGRGSDNRHAGVQIALHLTGYRPRNLQLPGFGIPFDLRHNPEKPDQGCHTKGEQQRHDRLQRQYAA